MPQVAVIHRDDWDGFAGLWVCRQYYAKRGPSYAVKSMALEAGKPFPIGVPGEFDTIIILNLAFDQMTLKEIHKATHLLLCGPALSERAPFYFGAEGKSSARTLWELLFTGPVPQLIRYLEDLDFDKLELQDTVFINHAIRSYQPTVVACQLLDTRLQRAQTASLLAQEGQAIVRSNRAYIAAAQKAAMPVIISGREGLGVNRAAFIDEIAAGLCRPKSYALVYYRSRKGWRYHLRATPAGLDVLEIAEPLGGIGMPQRASFTALHPPQLAEKESFEQITKRLKK